MFINNLFGFAESKSGFDLKLTLSLQEFQLFFVQAQKSDHFLFRKTAKIEGKTN